MSRLSALKQTKKYEINGVEMEFRSVSLDEDMGTLLDAGPNTDPQKLIPVLKKCIRKMVQEAVPDATEEELEECMRLNNLIPLMDAFYDVNGMANQEIGQSQKVKSALEERARAAKAKEQDTEQAAGNNS